MIPTLFNDFLITNTCISIVQMQRHSLSMLPGRDNLSTKEGFGELARSPAQVVDIRFHSFQLRREVVAMV